MADKALCLGFVLGVSDTLGVIQEMRKTNSGGTSVWRLAAVCFPDGVESAQIRDIAVKYLVDHPEGRTDSAASLVVLALTAAWACPAK
jgi:hypothetical protein